MKTVTIERWNTHTIHHSVKGITSKITNNIPHYDATIKNDTKQTFT